MSKKFRRVNAIMDTKFNGDINDSQSSEWDARCLAEYFFFSFYDKDEYECEFNSNDEYIHSNTKMEVIPCRQRERYFVDGKVRYHFVEKEKMIIYKKTEYGYWYPIFESSDMDEVCELFDMMNNLYSISWHTTYREFQDSYSYCI